MIRDNNVTSAIATASDRAMHSAIFQPRRAAIFPTPDEHSRTVLARIVIRRRDP